MKDNYTLRHLSIDFKDHKIASNGIELSIDFKAVEVLKLLIENEGETVEINSFMDVVWANKPSSPEVVTAAVARLRKLFKMAGFDEELIVTLHKVGYRFDSVNLESPENTTSTKKNKLLLPVLLALLIVSLAFHIKQYLSAPSNVNLSHTEIASINQESNSNVTQIYILRHAEKSNLNRENPVLSQEGIKRANYWKRVLQYTKFDRIYTTDFIRNIQTAKIVGGDVKAEPELYYPMSFEILKFIQQIQGQKVLIIGHSNTIPDMVNRIIDETKYPPMSHKNYNLMYIITINENGDTSSKLLHIEVPNEEVPEA